MCDAMLRVSVNAMDRRKLVAGLLIGAGTLTLGGVAVYAAKQRGLLGLSDGSRWSSWPRLGRASGNFVENNTAKRPKIASRVRVGDKVITHYRGNDIPIDQRVKLIQDRVYHSITKDPWTREMAAKIIHKCKSRDNMCQAQAIYDAVRQHVRYIGDVTPIKFPDKEGGEVEPIDYFQSARRTWEMGAGDCDDQVTLIASLASAVGIPARLRVTAPDKRSDWAHIYPILGFPVEGPRKWMALDTTLEDPTRMGHEIRFGKNRDYTPWAKDVPA